VPRLSVRRILASLHDFFYANFRAATLLFSLPGFVAWIATSCGIGLGFALSGGYHLDRYPPALLHAAVAATALALCAGILTRAFAVRFGAFLLFGFLACSLHGSRQHVVFGPLTSLPCEKIPITATGKVVSPPQPWFENFHFLLRIDSVTAGPLKQLKGLTINCTAPVEPSHYSIITVNGVYSPPRARKNPHEYDEFNALMAKGVWGYVEARNFELHSTNPTALERLSIAFRGTATRTLRKINDYDYRAVLQACFLGDTEFLSPYIKELFRSSGIYHLIAISGLNTAMLTAALYFLLRLLPLGRLVPHLICIAALWLYLLFVGMIPSLFRATIMATLVIVSLLFERKNYAMHTLGLAGTIWLALSPESLFGAGYQLSFAATAAILVLFPVVYRYLPPIKNRFARAPIVLLYSSLCISLVSFSATVPVMVYHFGTISWFGLIANLVAVSAMTVSMWAFFAALLCETLLPLLTFIPLWIAERFLDIVTGMGGLATRVSSGQVSCPSPWPELYVIFALFLIGCAVVRRERFLRFCAVALCAAAVVIPVDYAVRHSFKTAEAVRFVVDGGDLLAMRWPSGHSWLVCASFDERLHYRIGRQVKPWLYHKGSTRFNVLMAPTTRIPEARHAMDTAGILHAARLIPFDDARCQESRDTASDSGAGILFSQRASYYPCPGCTCSIYLKSGGMNVRIATLGVDTFFSLDCRKKRGKKRTAHCGGQDFSAEIFAFSPGAVVRSRVIKTAHPLAGAARPE
jgi:ComEC/Rec2-related protein